MKEIQAILVEDQELGMENLEFKIQKNCPGIKIVAKCRSGEEAIAAIQEHEPDLVFLDHDLGNMDGFQVLDRLDYLNFEVIFVTVHDKSAIQAINDYSPTYFLVKPIDDQKLVEGVSKARRAIEEKLRSKDFLAVRSIGKIERVPIKEISYLEANNNRTLIYTKNGRFFVYGKPLKHVTALLPGEQFLRIHRAYTVNLNLVHTILHEDNAYVCIIPHPQNKDGKKLPVGEKSRTALLRRI